MQSIIQINLANQEYLEALLDFLPTASYKQAVRAYDAVVNDPNLDPMVEADLAANDRYFLLTWVLRLGKTIPRIYHPWVYDRCRQVEAEPDHCLDLWSREHFKSTIITFGGGFQEIIKSAGEITIGIFSHNSKHSRDRFILRFKMEMETNPNLYRLWPDIFWEKPKKESPIWARDTGLVVKRSGNPPEPTISGWGLVDGQPTGSHFGLIIYDDVVTEKSVTTPEMIIKTTEMWELSTFMTQDQADGKLPRIQYIGTRYNYADTYQVMLDRNIATPRIHAATDDGTPDGKPVFLTQEQWDDKKKRTSGYTIACQMLQNPMAGEEREFKLEWIRYYEVRPEVLNIYITVDPASSKKKGSSYTAMVVQGVDHAVNKYLLDGAYHKMNLTERWKMLKRIYFKWLRAPGIKVVKVGYEKYGLQADIEHFKTMMKLEKCPFPIEEVSWPRERELGAKDDRIRRLIPDHANWRYFYPHPGKDHTTLQAKAIAAGKAYLVAKKIVRKNEEGRAYDVFDKMYRNEYLFFPATTVKDFQDAQSRIYDLDPSAPIVIDEKELYPDWMVDG